MFTLFETAESSTTTHTDYDLRAVVEVVPVVASANPVVVGSSIVGLVVGVSGGVVELAGLGVLAGGLGVESSGGLSVEGLEHLEAKVNKMP